MSTPIGPVPGPDRVPVERIKEVQFRMDQMAILHRITFRLSTRDLVRLNDLLAKCTEDELKRAAAFLEGLVEWRDPAPQSPDAQRT